MRKLDFSPRSSLLIAVMAVLGSLFAHSTNGDNRRISFRNEVMPVLSKAGCNLGACHGNQNGKGGFRLSLRGQDPDFDHQSIVREFHGRRIDRLDASASMILLKPLGRLPHQGGRRFAEGSREAAIIRRWLEQGASLDEHDESPQLTELVVAPRESVIVEPRDSLELKVNAVFSDGTKRDVRELAVYEASNLKVSVTPTGRVVRKSFGQATVVVRFLHLQVPVEVAFLPKRDYAFQKNQENNYIDHHVYRKLRELRIQPAVQAPDAVIVRRLYLDLLGVLPTMAEAKQFVADPRSDKRERLIEKLLGRPEFADHWALKWSDVLRNEEKVLDPTGVDRYHGWIRGMVSRSEPVDHFVRQLLISRGSTYDNPASNYYRANRDPATRAETTARLFLGIRLQCAKCHNHPFDRWTQDDYYSWAAMFAQVDYDIVNNKRRDGFDKNEFIGEQRVVIKSAAEFKNARTGLPAKPRPLGAEPEKGGLDHVASMAEWVTTNNQVFDQVMVNFIWYHMMGRGIVEPIDDFRLTNPPANTPLLEALTEDFVRHRYDLKHLVRVIATSNVYSQSAQPNETNRDDDRNFSRAIVRRLTAEQLIDAQSQVLAVPAEFGGYPKGTRAVEIPGVRRVRRRSGQLPEGDRFLFTFGKPERLLACECERSNETTLGQAFAFISGPSFHERLSSENNRIYELASQPDLMAGVTDLFWHALSRKPTPAEMAAFHKQIDNYLSTHGDSVMTRFEVLQDVTWSLLNAKEFIFRH